MTQLEPTSDPHATLRWLVDAGADEAIGENPVNRLVTPDVSTAPQPAQATAKQDAPALSEAAQTKPAQPTRPQTRPPAPEPIIKLESAEQTTATAKALAASMRSSN